MASGLQKALTWRWTPFFAIAAAAGLFAVGASSLLPAPVDRDTDASDRFAAAGLNPRGSDAKSDEDDDEDDTDEAATVAAKRREARRARAAARQKARLAPRATQDPIEETSGEESAAAPIIRPVLRTPKLPDAPEEDDAPEEVAAAPEVAPSLGARLRPGVLQNAKLMNRITEPALEEPAEAEDEPSDE